MPKKDYLSSGRFEIATNMKYILVSKGSYNLLTYNKLNIIVKIKNEWLSNW